jgi:hypothetical protein
MPQHILTLVQHEYSGNRVQAYLHERNAYISFKSEIFLRVLGWNISQNSDVYYDFPQSFQVTHGTVLIYVTGDSCNNTFYISTHL